MTRAAGEWVPEGRRRRRRAGRIWGRRLRGLEDALALRLLPVARRDCAVVWWWRGLGVCVPGAPVAVGLGEVVEER